jgi:hypothetical protein
MKTSTKIALASAVAVAIPAFTFAAAGSSNAFGGFGKGFGQMMGREIGAHMPFFQNGSGSVTVPSQIRQALAASGVTLPSDSDISAAESTMKAVMEAQRNFQPTDADKAALKAIRDAAAKSERDYLRTKGVTLPSEDEIAKAQATNDAVRSAFQTLHPGKSGKGWDKDREDGFGPMGGMMGGRGHGRR